MPIDDIAATAQRLAARFLEAGNYSFSNPISGGALSSILPMAEDIDEVKAYVENVGFAGLAVQAVGYEDREDGSPRIHIYVTKGRHLEREFDGISLEVNRVGRITVRPELASSATHIGHVFQLSGRIACGSSCAPSGERLSGTLGALIQKSSSNDIFILSNNHVLAAGNHVQVGMPILSPSPADASPGTRAVMQKFVN